MSTSAYIDLLRLTGEQVVEIVQELVKADGSPRRKSQDRRVHQRLPFHEDALLLCELKNGRGGGPPFLVKCIDVSAGGLGFLHGAFVHANTPCTITLIVRKKSGFRIDGKIVRCEHHRGHVHVVGVKFDTELDVKSLEAMGK